VDDAVRTFRTLTATEIVHTVIDDIKIVNCDNADVCFLETGARNAFNFGFVAIKIAQL